MTKEQTRRDWLLKTGAVAVAALAPFPSAAQTPAATYPRNLTKADIERLMAELSNWGRWGIDDQAGTINLITPAKRRQAAALVKDGVSVSMSIDADIAKAGKAPPQGRPIRPSSFDDTEDAPSGVAGTASTPARLTARAPDDAGRESRCR